MCCPSYYGWIDEKHNNRSYPPLITQELYEKCRAIADENRLEIKRGERLILGSKIVRCKDCGAAYTIESRHMSCCRANRKTCDNTISLRQSVIDYILWQVAFSRHLDYLLDLSASDAEKYSEQIKVIDQKIIYFNEKIKRSDDLKQRAIDVYLEGLINKQKRDQQIAKIDTDNIQYQNEINALNEQKMAIQGLLGNIDKDLEELNMLNALDIVEAAEQNKQTMFNIIHKHIIKVIPDRIQLGKSKRKRKRKTNKENGILLSVYTIHSDVPVQYVYVPRKYNNEVLFKWNGEEWCPEHIDIKEMEKE